MNTQNTNPIAACKNGIMVLDDKATAWETAIDVVSYPVSIRPLFFKPSDECAISIPNDNGFAEARGDTKTGRDSQFFGVVVDRDRVCDEQVIAVVTGTYGTLDTAAVYADLKKDLEENNIASSPRAVYVSGNGGRAILSVAIDDAEATTKTSNVKMNINLDTSVDGTRKHTLRLSVVDKDGVEMVGLGEQSFTVGAKHTKTIGERHVAFQTVLVKLAKEWDETIEPMIALMNDCVFDRTFAIDIFNEVMQNADIPERHIKNALASYRPDAKESLFGVLHGVSSYLSTALEDKPERLEEFREKINKKSKKIISETIERFKKV